MKEKIIAVDLDGTLAKSDSFLSINTIKGIQKLTQLGYKVILTTGRTWMGTKNLYETTKLDTPLVLYNGAYVYLPSKKQVMQSITIEREFVFELLQNDEFLELIDNVVAEYQEQSFVLRHMSWLPDEIPGDFRKTLQIDPTAVIFRVKNRECQEKMKELIGRSSEYAYRYWGDHFGEVYHKTLSKKDGIEVVLKYYGATKKDLIFFGDSQNDVEIIEYANVGVAMANAKDYIKAAADEITKYSNDEDGVIRHLFEKIGIPE